MMNLFENLQMMHETKKETELDKALRKAGYDKNDYEFDWNEPIEYKDIYGLLDCHNSSNNTVDLKIGSDKVNREFCSFSMSDELITKFLNNPENFLRDYYNEYNMNNVVSNAVWHHKNDTDTWDPEQNKWVNTKLEN